MPNRSSVRRDLYKTARVMGDVEAIRRGRVGRRVAGRLGWKLTKAALRALTK